MSLPHNHADGAAEPSPWNLPNALTVFRMVLVPCFGLLLWASEGDRASWLVAAAVAFVVGVVTDYYDGLLARAQGQVTSFGKLADPIADKALTGTALVGLCMLDLLSWPVAVIIVVRELGVTGLRFAVIRRGIIAASRGGKIKTVLQMVAITWYLWPWEATATWLTDNIGVGLGLDNLTAAGPPMMAAAVVVTVVTGLDYVRRAWSLRRQSV